MKINIKKLALGGVYNYTPPPVYQEPILEPENTKTSTTKTKSNELEDISKLLIGKGITSDVNVYFKQLNKHLSEIQNMPSVFKDSYKTETVLSQMMDPSKINAILRNAQQFDAIKQSKETSMDETAIYNGRVITMNDTGNLDFTSINEYSKNPNSYRALTNRDLVKIREEDENYAGNNSIFNILQNATNFEDVVKVIKTTASDLGKITSETENASYEQKEIAEGVNQLTKNKSGNYTSSNKEAIRNALTGIWNTMSDNNKDLLRVRAAQSGIQDPKLLDEAAKSIIFSVLNPRFESTEKNTYDLSAGKGKSGGGGSEKTENIGILQRLVSGESETTGDILLSHESGYAYKLNGNKINFVPTKEGRPIKETQLSNMEAVRAVGDMNNVYFGDTKIPTEQLDAVVYDGGSLYAVDLPYIPTSSGYKPDLHRYEQLEAARKEIARLPKGMGIEQKAKIYGKYLFDVLPNGELAPTQTRKFLVFKAYVNDEAVNLDNEKWKKESPEWEDKYKSIYETNMSDYGDGKKTIKRREYGWFPWSDPNIYTGNIFIPVADNAPSSARSFEGNNIKILQSQAMAENYKGHENKKDITILQDKSNLNKSYFNGSNK